MCILFAGRLHDATRWLPRLQSPCIATCLYLSGQSYFLKIEAGKFQASTVQDGVLNRLIIPVLGNLEVIEILHFIKKCDEHIHIYVHIFVNIDALLSWPLAHWFMQIARCNTPPWCSCCGRVVGVAQLVHGLHFQRPCLVCLHSYGGSVEGVAQLTQKQRGIGKRVYFSFSSVINNKNR